MAAIGAFRTAEGQDRLDPVRADVVVLGLCRKTARKGLLETGADEIAAFPPVRDAGAARRFELRHGIAGRGVEQGSIEAETEPPLAGNAPVLLDAGSVDEPLGAAHVRALDLDARDGRTELHVVAALKTADEAVAVGREAEALAEGEAAMGAEIEALPAIGGLLIVFRGRVLITAAKIGGAGRQRQQAADHGEGKQGTKHRTLHDDPGAWRRSGYAPSMHSWSSRCIAAKLDALSIYMIIVNLF